MLSDFVKYVKQYWHDRPDKSTPLNADRLNHIENGIGSNSEAINQIANAVVSNIVNDPEKIASMAAVYALQEKLGTGELPSDAPNAISAINTLYSNLISVKTFEIEITTGSTKDPASGLYIGSYKLIESPSYPEGENILAVIPYGARTKLDAGRSAMVAYRASDTRISINSPNQPNEVFVVNIAVFYSFSNN